MQLSTSSVNLAFGFFLYYRANLAAVRQTETSQQLSTSYVPNYFHKFTPRSLTNAIPHCRRNVAFNDDVAITESAMGEVSSPALPCLPVPLDFSLSLEPDARHGMRAYASASVATPLRGNDIEPRRLRLV